MSDVFGIDLGTTNSSISRLVEGKPVALSIDGKASLPSIVLYRDGRVIVGREARNLELQFPESTVRSVKRRMGQEHRFAVDGREVTPEQVSAEILGTLKRAAEQVTGEQVRQVVITVPAYFDDAQRRATLAAGELAGLDVLRLLNEPTSASLVYDQLGDCSQASPEIVLVYDLGGGTFDVSVLEVCDGVREVRATAGDTRLGGDDFDDALVARFVEELRRGGGADPVSDPRAMVRLRRAAEAAKLALSADTEVRVREEFVCADERGQPVHLDLVVTRRELEELIAPRLEATIALCRKAIEDAKLVGQRLERICLVGGSTRIPMVRALLAEAFEAEIHEGIDPDLAVALGAATQAGMLAGVPIERILVDVASHSLGVRVLGPEDFGFELADTFAPVLRRNTVLPAIRVEEFYTVCDNQAEIDVEVFQGEAARVSQNALVGSFRFPLRPVPEHSPVRVEFSYDLNGVVRVSVSQPGTDNSKTVALSLADAARRDSAEQTPLERKARALLTRLSGKSKDRLQELLDVWLKASVPADKIEAEEALLDFFLEADDDAEDAEESA